MVYWVCCYKNKPQSLTKILTLQIILCTQKLVLQKLHSILCKMVVFYKKANNSKYDYYNAQIYSWYKGAFSPFTTLCETHTLKLTYFSERCHWLTDRYRTEEIVSASFSTPPLLWAQIVTWLPPASSCARAPSFILTRADWYSED